MPFLIGRADGADESTASQLHEPSACASPSSRPARSFSARRPAGGGPRGGRCATRGPSSRASKTRPRSRQPCSAADPASLGVALEAVDVDPRRPGWSVDDIEADRRREAVRPRSDPRPHRQFPGDAAINDAVVKPDARRSASDVPAPLRRSWSSRSPPDRDRRIAQALERYSASRRAASRTRSASTATAGESRQHYAARFAGKGPSGRRSAAEFASRGGRSRSPVARSRRWTPRTNQGLGREGNAGAIDLSMSLSKGLQRRSASSPTAMLEPLYTAAEMRAAEERYPGSVEEPMERAGRAVAERALEDFGNARRSPSSAGRGSNGGDGVAARGARGGPAQRPRRRCEAGGRGEGPRRS